MATGSLAIISAASASPLVKVSTVVNSPGLNLGCPLLKLTPKGYPVCQATTLSAPVTLPCPLAGFATK